MIPLFSAEQVRTADNFAIKELNIPGEILMENAAISIAKAILEKYPYIDLSYKFGIICGKGNNGGDGFALARQLLILGFDVNILSMSDEKGLKGDALTNYLIIKKFISDYKDSELYNYKSLRDINKLNGCDVIVDAILGTGSSGELKDPYDKIVKKLNAFQSLKIAVDLPTGLDLENASGDIIFNANLTVTLAALKSGLFYEKGRSCSGKVVSGSIGIGSKYFETLRTDDYLIEPEDVLDFLPRKGANIHKYSAGKVLVIAGSSELPGAAIFSINAAMMSGSGSGLLAFPKSIRKLAQSQMNSAVVLDYEDGNLGHLTTDNIDEISSRIEWADAIAIGPGLGRNDLTQEAVLMILDKFNHKKIVIDADAIFSLGHNIYKKVDLSGKIITPHHGEFATLIGISLNELKLNILDYGRRFAKETNSHLVLKGAPTIIFNPQNEIFINSSGNSGLAKFGSGDVLTGILASFVAQEQNIEQSVIAAVYTHSLTADLIMKKESEFGITPQKLIDNFSNTIKFLRKSVV